MKVIKCQDTVDADGTRTRTSSGSLVGQDAVSQP